MVHLIDELLPYQRYRQGVVPLPIDLRYLASTRRGLLSQEFDVVGIDSDKLVEIALTLAAVQQASTVHFIGLGERAGHPVRKIGRSMGYVEEEPRSMGLRCVRQNGFTLHADRMVKGGDR